MSVISDLSAAVAQTSTSLDALTTAIATIQPAGTPDSAITPIVTQVQANNDKLAAAVAAIQNAVTPPPTPAAPASPA